MEQYLTSFRSYQSLRHTDHLFFFIPRSSEEIGCCAFKYKAPSNWNSLPCSLRSFTSSHLFETSLLPIFKHPAQLPPCCNAHYQRNQGNLAGEGLLGWALSAWVREQASCTVVCCYVFVMNFIFFFLFLFFFFVGCDEDPLENKMIHLRGIRPNK